MRWEKFCGTYKTNITRGEKYHNLGTVGVPCGKPRDGHEMMELKTTQE